MSRRRRRERGGALVLTILTILILTVVGLGIAYFTQIEDKVSGNARTQKSSLYAAESGLRNGEKLISTAYGLYTGFNFLGTLLANPSACSSTPTLTMPDSGNGGFTAIGLCITTGGVSTLYTDQLVDPTDATQGRYSLYVRNNGGDKTGDPETDSDASINLVAIGTAPGGVTRILEEGIALDLSGLTPPGQAGGGPGGTGSIVLP